MDTVTLLFFLSSGLFLGWSLGANDASNVFGTAVGSRMIRFSTAAFICSAFVILGAVVSGAGAAHTLGKLGAVNELGGAFTVALAAALTIYFMTKLGLPVSTSQGIVGAIIGWNIYANKPTDYSIVSKIVATWVVCPLLSIVFAGLMFYLGKFWVERSRIHLIRMDAYTRLGLVVAGAFGSYSLGANNIANVVGVFVPSSPFKDLTIFGNIQLSATHQLFLLGAVAIGVGIYTYSKGVMMTIGSNIYRLSPISALVVVLAESLVLFLFASRGLHDFLVSHGIPPIPLVPVSSSQAAVGAVIGVGLAKGGRNVNTRVLGRISLGWMATPIIAGVICYVSLYIFQNVFIIKVFS